MRETEAPSERERLEAPPPDDPAVPSLSAQTVRLYDAMAPDYDASFDSPTHRRAYDLLAGEYIEKLLPPTPGLIVDVGCGTGRWAAQWTARGHRVIGIEQSPGMVAVLMGRKLGSKFTLVASPMETTELPESRADLVVAMDSVQYASDPAAMVKRFASWTKPGGFVCAFADSLMALALELARLGKTEETIERLETGRGVFRVDAQRAEMRLYDADTLRADFVAAGLSEIECRGVLITSSAWGREGCAAALAQDEASFLALERRLSAFPLMTNAGRRVLAWGRRPMSEKTGA